MAHFTMLTSGAMPWMRTSRRSPDSMGPTPAGVPVRITSPGRRVMLVEMKLTKWKQLKIIWLVLPFCRNCPFWKSWMLRSCGSILVSMYGPSGVKVSKDLERANWLSLPWMVRSVMSCDAV